MKGGRQGVRVDSKLEHAKDAGDRITSLNAGMDQMLSLGGCGSDPGGFRIGDLAYEQDIRLFCSDPLEQFAT